MLGRTHTHVLDGGHLDQDLDLSDQIRPCLDCCSAAQRRCNGMGWEATRGGDMGLMDEWMGIGQSMVLS
jgi:hypothetical protein